MMHDTSLTRRVVVALVVAEVTIAVGPAPLRVVAGLTLGLVLPGLVVARVLAGPQSSGTDQTLLVPGMSIVIAIITGLVLNAAHIPLTAENWALALGAATGIGLAVAMVMGRGEHRAAGLYSDSSARPPDVASGGGGWMPALGSAAMLAVAGVAVTGAFVIGVSGEHYRGPGFTQLWAVPRGGSAVGLGARSYELHNATYLVRVFVDDRETRSDRIALRPGQTWESTQPLARRGECVEIQLEKLPSSSVYREIHTCAL